MTTSDLADLDAAALELLAGRTRRVAVDRNPVSIREPYPQVSDGQFRHASRGWKWRS